ncbi:ParB N-terminal domain-containing protein [Pelosinus sp. IPA-1]|uniref:ParB/RepB/Spo0J family partition protein n=1 Tax=Pelosinus sp. IPA-1 TaxID=3029569 RepID=UPI0024362235|nr:ParB N-terminal domain-containing protein [Pelosinus sp. IPA-1]GMB01056.1 hypothetical protein PIPA1_38550 [Pelosinus sp. IPA-1]
MAFDMLAAMGKRTAAAAPSIVMIDIDNLIPNTKNFYRVEGDSEIEKQNEQLKATIEMYGVKQPLIVKTEGNGKFSIIAGERRYLACRRLTDEGKENFKLAPCIVEKAQSVEDEQIELIITNHHRDKDLSEKIEEVRQLSELLQKKKERGEKMQGKLQDIIAEMLNMSKSEVGRLQQIDKNLQPELKEAIKNKDLAMTSAVELSKLSAADQKAVYEKTGGKVTAKEVKQYQQGEPEKAVVLENLNLDGFEEKQQKTQEVKFEFDEFGRRDWGDIQSYKEYDEIIDIKDDRLFEKGYRLYIVQDKEDQLWRSTAARGFIEVGAGRWPHRDKKNPKDSKLYPAFNTRDEAYINAVNKMFYNADDKTVSVLNELGYIKQEEESAVSSEMIQAAMTMQALLEKAIDKRVNLIQEARANRDFKKEKELEAVITYIGTSLLPKVQDDLFKMKGQDIF